MFREPEDRKAERQKHERHRGDSRQNKEQKIVTGCTRRRAACRTWIGAFHFFGDRGWQTVQRKFVRHNGNQKHVHERDEAPHEALNKLIRRTR